MSESKWTPGPWRWQGEDYRGGWGWQILVGPDGEGLIVGQGPDCQPYKNLRAHVPLDPKLCITGMEADGKERAECVHVFSKANARLIQAAPDMAEALTTLLHEVLAAGFDNATDYNWPNAILGARKALAKVNGD